MSAAGWASGLARRSPLGVRGLPAALVSVRRRARSYPFSIRIRKLTPGPASWRVGSMWGSSPQEAGPLKGQFLTGRPSWLQTQY